MKGSQKDPYATLPQTYDAMQREMAARGLSGTPPEETRTEVIWPVQPKG
jgi:hypothetical protein